MRAEQTNPPATGDDRSIQRRVFDPQTGTEWSLWWSIPGRARLYNGTVVFAAVAATIGTTIATRMTGRCVLTLGALLLGGMANVELGRLAEGGRVDRQRIHKGLSAWPFAAALLLTPGRAGWVAAVIYVHAWIRGMRITKWKWIGSWAIVTLAALAAAVNFQLLTDGRLPVSGSETTAAAVAVALGVFLAVESLLLWCISRLNTPADEVYLRAQLASASFYLIEASVLASGAIAAVLYNYSPGFLLLGGPASLLMQRGMLHQPLQHQARHDAKTGVLNCEAWRAVARPALRHARRDGRPMAVLVVDVDHFKDVNDTFGHLVGDEVLTEAADAVVRGVRRTDLVGRFGGDEFCALLACNTADEVMAAAERIRGQIGQLVFPDASVKVTASIGIAMTGDDDADGDLDKLIAAADHALYEAKRGGRDRICTHINAGSGSDQPRLLVTNSSS